MWTRRRLAAHALVLGAFALCGLLSFAPRSFALPGCPIHQTFGILCPGCGATRALAALLRGHLLQALRLNALFVALLPAAVAWAATAYRRALHPGPFEWPAVPAPALYAVFAASAVFAVARNLVR